MKKYYIGRTLTGFAMGVALTAGLTWNGQESINQIQGRVDRLAARVISLVDEVTGLERELEYKGYRYESQTEERESLASEVARLENELRMANQAVETLDTNTRDRYENAMEIYNGRNE